MKLRDLSYLGEAVRCFGFGACIEVANGIDHGGWREKTCQGLSAKNVLKNLVSADYLIRAGISHTSHWNHADLEALAKPDFSIQVRDICHEFSTAAFAECLNGKKTYLVEKEAALVDKIRIGVETGEISIEDFIYQKPLLNDALGLTDAEKATVGGVKGVFMEMYIAAIFENLIREDKRVVHKRIWYDLRGMKLKNFVDYHVHHASDIDVFVACKRKELGDVLRFFENEGYIKVTVYN